ncbi:hypothetical protein PFISCL1PPCAC_24202, partial [Pristionchus fissidentatus]
VTMSFKDDKAIGMLTRRKKQNAHTFLEGTSGSYVPRSAPPPIPICVSSIATLQNEKYSPSPSPTSSLPKKASIQSINSVTGSIHDSSSQKKASTISLAPSVSSLVENGGYHLNGRSDQRPLPHRRVPSGQQPLSSHSFNYDRPRKVLAPSLSFSMLGSHEGQFERNEIKTPPSPLDLRGIPATESVGHSMETPLPQHRFVSTSLQHLPARSTMGSTSIIEMTGNDDAVAGNIPEEELELPENWTVESYATRKQGTNEAITLRYYVDHNTKRTHWLHPLVKEKLPAGWRKDYTPELGVVYHNDHLGRSQYDHPGLAKTAGPSPMSASVGHNIGLLHTSSQSALQPSRPVQQPVVQPRIDSAAQQMQAHFNQVRDEDVPEWLRLYCRAPQSTDHLLDWNLFSLPNLEHYWALMYRLFRQDIIDAVRKKERHMLELQLEIARREQELSQSQSNQR